MIKTLVLPLFTKITFSFAIFASSTIAATVTSDIDAWSLVGIALFFVVARSMFTRLMNHWKPKDKQTQMLVDVIKLLLETHWQTFTFIIVNWLVAVLQLWWKLTEEPIAAAAIVNMPLFLLVSVVEYAKTTSAKEFHFLQIADAMLGRMIFSIAFFASSIIQENIQLEVDTWNWFMLVLFFGILKGTVAYAFSLWKLPVDSEGNVPKEALGESKLKVSLERNWEIISLTAVFFLVDIFSGIIQNWWDESEDVLVGVALLNSILLISLTLLAYFSEHPRFTSAFPKSILDRALFAMALFLAEKADSGFVPMGEWYLFWLFISIATLSYSLDFAFGKWEPKDSGVKTFKTALQLTSSTWVTIAVSFTVKLVVDVFKELFQAEESAFVSVATSEIVLLIMITSVYLLDPTSAEV